MEKQLGRRDLLFRTLEGHKELRWSYAENVVMVLGLEGRGKGRGVLLLLLLLLLYYYYNLRLLLLPPTYYRQFCQAEVTVIKGDEAPLRSASHMSLGAE